MSILGNFLKRITSIGDGNVVDKTITVDESIKEKVKDLYSNDSQLSIYREMTELFTRGVAATGFKTEHIPQRDLTEAKISSFTVIHERYCKTTLKKDGKTTTQYKTIQHQFKREDIAIYLTELSSHLQSLNYCGDYSVLDKILDLYYDCVDRSHDSIKEMKRPMACSVILEFEKLQNSNIVITIQRGQRAAALSGINRIELFENHSYVFRKN